MPFSPEGSAVDDLGRQSVRVDRLVDLPPGANELMNVQETAARCDPYRVTADSQVVAGPCYVLGFVATGGTSPTLDLHNGTSTSDPVVIGGGAAHTLGVPVSLPGAVFCPTGVYANVGGTNPAYTVFILR